MFSRQAHCGCCSPLADKAAASRYTWLMACRLTTAASAAASVTSSASCVMPATRPCGARSLVTTAAAPWRWARASASSVPIWPLAPMMRIIGVIKRPRR